VKRFFPEHLAQAVDSGRHIFESAVREIKKWFGVFSGLQHKNQNTITDRSLERENEQWEKCHEILRSLKFNRISGKIGFFYTRRSFDDNQDITQMNASSCGSLKGQEVGCPTPRLIDSE